jgi:hypothetical protein
MYTTVVADYLNKILLLQPDVPVAVQSTSLFTASSAFTTSDGSCGEKESVCGGSGGGQVQEWRLARVRRGGHRRKQQVVNVLLGHPVLFGAVLCGFCAHICNGHSSTHNLLTLILRLTHTHFRSCGHTFCARFSNGSSSLSLSVPLSAAVAAAAFGFLTWGPCRD